MIGQIHKLWVFVDRKKFNINQIMIIQVVITDRTFNSLFS